MINNKVCSKAILFTFIASLSLLGYNLAKAQNAWPGRPNIHPGMSQAIQASQQGQGGQNRAPLEKNMSLLGFMPFASFSTSDVWALGNFAYVGGLGSNPVRVVDISDPANPQLVAQLPGIDPQLASPQDVKAAKIKTKFFKGDLLVVGNDGPLGGIQLWDVSDPSNPAPLSTLTFPDLSFVHNTFLYQKGNRAFVLLAIPFEEQFPGPVGKDFAVVEVTDPTQPEIVGSWTAGADGGFPFGFGPNPFGAPVSCNDPTVCRGSFAASFCHDVWVNTQGTVAYLSYWDLGLILLDISDPTDPTFIGRGVEPITFGGNEGDLHAAVPAQGGNLVITGDEALAPVVPFFGFLRVFDTSNATNPFQVGAFATPGSLNDPSLTRTMHNIFVRGSRAYLSWYDEGIRVVDISQPSSPREIAAFIADPAQTSPGFFWGVYEHQDLILASDILGGLFILKQEASGLLNKSAAANTDLGTPMEFALQANYPNPFNPETTIRFQIPEASHVVIRILNTLGQEIRTLTNRQYEPGSYSIHWDGKDDDANSVGSGIYLFKLETDKFSQVRKMTLLR